jgi:hypothetical protein
VFPIIPAPELLVQMLLLAGPGVTDQGAHTVPTRREVCSGTIAPLLEYMQHSSPNRPVVRLASGYCAESMPSQSSLALHHYNALIKSVHHLEGNGLFDDTTPVSCAKVGASHKRGFSATSAVCFVREFEEWDRALDIYGPAATWLLLSTVHLLTRGTLARAARMTSAAPSYSLFACFNIGLVLLWVLLASTVATLGDVPAESASTVLSPSPSLSTTRPTITTMTPTATTSVMLRVAAVAPAPSIDSFKHALLLVLLTEFAVAGCQVGLLCKRVTNAARVLEGCLFWCLFCGSTYLGGVFYQRVQQFCREDCVWPRVVLPACCWVVAVFLLSWPMEGTEKGTPHSNRIALSRYDDDNGSGNFGGDSDSGDDGGISKGGDVERPQGARRGERDRQGERAPTPANPRAGRGAARGARPAVSLALAFCVLDDVGATCVVDGCDHATLPMYDFPEIRNATDEWWQGISAHVSKELAKLSPACAPLPTRLNRALPFPPWRLPKMCFSQTCGFPLTNEYRGDLRALATPHYSAEGCSGHLYSSLVVVRDDSPLTNMSQLAAFAQGGDDGGVVAVNSLDSQSVSLTYFPAALVSITDRPPVCRPCFNLLRLV